MNTKEACALAYQRCTRTESFAFALVGGISWVEVKIDDVPEKDVGFFVDLINRHRMYLTFFSGNDSEPMVLVTNNELEAYDFICNFIEDFEE